MPSDHAAYMREWRRRNPEKERAIKLRYWVSKGRETAKRRAERGPMRPYQPSGRSAEERFWEKVEIGADCWVWRSGTDRATFWVNRDRAHVKAYRFSWELTFGAIPPGMEVCHRCDNPRCVRPDHLFLGTHAENMADMARKGRGNGPRLAGEDSPRARLNWVQVREIRELRDGGWTLRHIAARYGVAYGTIRRIVTGEGWSDAA